MDPDEHVALLSRTQGEGVEVQDFFADAVESAKLTFTEADRVALKAAEKATAALQKLNQATAKLREAEEKRCCVAIKDLSKIGTLVSSLSSFHSSLPRYRIRKPEGLCCYSFQNSFFLPHSLRVL